VLLSRMNAVTCERRWNTQTVMAHHAVTAAYITRIAWDKAQASVGWDEDGIWAVTKQHSTLPVIRKPNRTAEPYQFKEWWATSKAHAR